MLSTKAHQRNEHNGNSNVKNIISQYKKKFMIFNILLLSSLTLTLMHVFFYTRIAHIIIP